MANGAKLAVYKVIDPIDPSLLESLLPYLDSHLLPGSNGLVATPLPEYLTEDEASDYINVLWTHLGLQIDVDTMKVVGSTNAAYESLTRSLKSSTEATQTTSCFSDSCFRQVLQGSEVVTTFTTAVRSLLN